MSGIQARLGSFRATLSEKNVAGPWKLPSFILVLPLWSPMVSPMTEVPTSKCPLLLFAHPNSTVKVQVTIYFLHENSANFCHQDQILYMI